MVPVAYAIFYYKEALVGNICNIELIVGENLEKNDRGKKAMEKIAGKRRAREKGPGEK